MLPSAIPTCHRSERLRSLPFLHPWPRSPPVTQEHIKEHDLARITLALHHQDQLTLIRMTKDEKGLVFFKGLLL